MKIDFTKLTSSRTYKSSKRIATAHLHAWRVFKRFLFRLMEASFIVFLIFFIPFFIGNFVLSTPRAQAYRNLHPSLPVCQEGLKGPGPGWTVLAEVGAENSRAAAVEDEESWTDPSNNEQDAISIDKSWATKLRCALQKHIVPERVYKYTTARISFGFFGISRKWGAVYAKKARAIGGGVHNKG